MKGMETGSVASIDLEPIKNVYLKSDVSFTTGAGTKVHLTSYVASNCPDGGTSCATKDKIFLVLTTDRNENYFVRAIEIVNWGIFMHGSKTVAIDGEKYVLKAYANVSAPDNSKIEIKGPRGVALISSLQQVADAQARKGTEVNLSKTYKLLYGSEILQGPQGVRFGPSMQVVLIQFPVTDKSDTKIFNVSELTPSGVSFPSFESGYSFRLENGILGIYKL
jgi:antitoxin component HigA of HigAB toxin-antitoxin module